ncbi:MAG TPA: sigma 54-interacting transcriptional regulator [Polyangiaceae bacterium]|nr:sigma 54-interacting transcriptional regulator [Polyangiaceae bacterium]
MSSPPDQYPNGERKYPNAEPELPNLPFQPAFEAELYRLAPSRVTVLLVGGSAPLKNAVARALHERSTRAAEPFVVVDCRGLDSDSVELDLFGGPMYVPSPGGAIHRAGDGTLYVASIDELPLLVQPRFLRFLDQDRQARVVASAEQRLLTRVEQGHFRLDLAERLTLVELVLPGAR